MLPHSFSLPNLCLVLRIPRCKWALIPPAIHRYLNGGVYLVNTSTFHDAATENSQDDGLDAHTCLLGSRCCRRGFKTNFSCWEILRKLGFVSKAVTVEDVNTAGKRRTQTLSTHTTISSMPSWESTKPKWSLTWCLILVRQIKTLLSARQSL
jgi:hypothetical protein